MKSYNTDRFVKTLTNRNILFMAAFSMFMMVMPSIMAAQHADAAGSWSYIGTVRYDNVGIHNPEGLVNLQTPIYKNIDDGSSTKDFYQYRLKENPVPGAQQYGSTWVNKYMDLKMVIVPSNQYLKDHDPVDDCSSPASIAITIPQSVTFTYTISEICVNDKTVYSKTPWFEHTWNGIPSSSTRTTAYTSSPAFTMEVAQNDPSLVDGWYIVRFSQNWCESCQYEFKNTSALYFDSTMAT